MNWNIFWGLYTLAFAVATLLVWYFLYYRKKHYTELCSVKTTGTVVRYSAVRYNDISLPVVEYTANGRTYTVVGPKFSATVTKSFSSPFHRAESPLLELYPIGSKVDVFYNPRKPKMAYVQRFARPQKVLYTIVLLLDLTFLAAALFVFFGPTITMH